MRYSDKSGGLGKQVSDIYNSYAVKGKSKETLQGYAKLAGAEKFSYKQINGMSHWVKDYLSSDAPEIQKQAVMNGMREINKAVRYHIMTQNLAKGEKYLPLLHALDDTITDYERPGRIAQPAETKPVVEYKAPQLKIVKPAQKEQPKPAYKGVFTGLKRAAAGALLTLAACAGLPSTQDYKQQADAALKEYNRLNESSLTDKYSIVALDAIIDAHKLYRSAEDADKTSNKFTVELTKTRGMGESVAAKILSRMNDRDAFIKYEKLARDEGFLDNMSNEDAKRYDDALRKFSLGPYAGMPPPPSLAKKPEPAAQPKPAQDPDKALDEALKNAEQPKPAETAKPAEQATQPEKKPEPAAQPAQPPAVQAPSVPKGPYNQDRGILSFDIGSMQSSQDRAGSLDARYAGFDLLAHGHADKWREETSNDKTRETGFGAAASADLDEIVGLPLKLGASFYQGKRNRGSTETDRQVDSMFVIDTSTETDQTDTDTFVAASAKGTIGNTTIGLTGSSRKNETKVDVTTDLRVINLIDPAGNYTRNWTDTYTFTTDTTSVQASLEQKLDENLKVGAIFTADLEELKELERNIDLYTLDLYFRGMTPDRKYGGNVLIGQGLQDDQGENNDRFTKPRYAFAAGAELTDWLTVGGQFNRREDPDGSLIFVIGSNGILPHLLDRRWQENMGRMDLLRNLPPELQKVYLAGLRNDFNWFLGQKNEWMFAGDAGARRVQTLDEGDKTVFNGSGTLFIPVHRTFTADITPYIEWENLYRRYGVELGGSIIGDRLRFFLDASRERTDGRSNQDEDFRAFGGFGYWF